MCRLSGPLRHKPGRKTAHLLAYRAKPCVRVISSCGSGMRRPPDRMGYPDLSHIIWPTKIDAATAQTNNVDATRTEPPKVETGQWRLASAEQTEPHAHARGRWLIQI